LKAVDKTLQLNKPLLKTFREKWQSKLLLVPKRCEEELDAVIREEPINLAKVPGVVLSLSKEGTACTNIMTRMTGQARAIEQEQMGNFTRTQQWIFVVGFLCLILNSVVVASLFFYFSRGTPRRLRQLAEQAAKLSRQRGLAPAAQQDELADLDMVLQELATALNEAEERERLLREELKESKEA
jgi:hypothetical protein